MKTLEGQLTAQGMKVAIVVARFNEFITSKLLSGAIDCLERHGMDNEDITAVWVPGAFEIPLAAQKLAVSGKYDAVSVWVRLSAVLLLILTMFVPKLLKAWRMLVWKQVFL